MSRRARARANARPWETPEALALGPDPDDEIDEPPHDEWVERMADVEQDKELVWMR